MVVVPRLDGEGVVEYPLEFSGLPHQCGRCRSRDHQVWHCPKNDPQGRCRELRHGPRTGRRGKGVVPTHASPLNKDISTPQYTDPSRVQEEASEHGEATLLNPGLEEALGVNTNLWGTPQIREGGSPNRLQDNITSPSQEGRTEHHIGAKPTNVTPVAYNPRTVKPPERFAADDACNRDPPHQPRDSPNHTTIINTNHTSTRRDDKGYSEQDEDEATIHQEKKTKLSASTGREDPPFLLLQDDIDFPRLPSSARRSSSPPKVQRTLHSPPASQVQTPQTSDRVPTFIWRHKPPHEEFQNAPEPLTEKGKGKAPRCQNTIHKALDSVPITRQGYRTGRLAEDFWGALGIPNTPLSSRKTLQVIPLLTKDQNTENAEYLVDKRVLPHRTIVQAQVAEQLAGIPWTTKRARQHVVDETSQALHKVLIFNNNLSNPFQNWDQGRWFGSWSEEQGEYTCTLFANVTVLEPKVKPHKGQNFKWQQVPESIREQVARHTTDGISSIEKEHIHWIRMAGAHIPGNIVIPSNHTAASNTEETPSSAATPPNYT